jgi:hypothetical protein
MYAFNESLTGPIDQPSPRISSVTPWRMSDWERPSWMSEALAQHIMLMKPGATANPRGVNGLPGAAVYRPDVGDRVAADGEVAGKGAPPLPS